MGSLQEGDQAIVDALQRLPAEVSSIQQAPHEAVVTDFTGGRETTLGLPKDHWSVASADTDNEGTPERAEVTLVQVSPKDINVVIRGDSVADEIRTEEDKPKAIDRAKLHDNKTGHKQSFVGVASVMFHYAYMI